MAVGRSIDEFMWGWQPHFRIDLQVTAERALEAVGAQLDPQAFLVGFAVEPAQARYPVCVEPEDGAFRSSELRGIAGRAEEIYEADPERRIFNTDPGLDERRQAWLRRRARGDAIAEAAEASGAFPGKRVFVSSAGLVEGFEVHSCLAVDSASIDGLPRLEGEEVNRFPAPGSFIGELIKLVLIEADIALGQREPGLSAIRRSSRDLALEAAESFAGGCFFRTRNFSYFHPCDPLSEIAIRTYESATAHGRLLLVHPEHDTLDVHLHLERPVPLTSARAVRKLLEITDDDLALLVHTDGVYGLGRVVEGLAGDVFEVSITAHATWELRGADGVLLRFEYRRPTLPRPILDMGALVDAFERLLGEAVDEDAVLPLVRAAMTARHGTTLVVSADAASEAVRLGGQATTVTPTPATAELLNHIAQIDGAVLVDPEGTCHAIGVILDGEVTAQGDPSRGARYNSAHRYQRSAPCPTVVVIVSEDGDVTLVPHLKPRVRRQTIDDAVMLLESAAEEDRPEAFSEAYDRVKDLAFYLSPAQVERVNELAEAEQELALSNGAIAIIRPELRPDPELNDSYFSE